MAVKSSRKTWCFALAFFDLVQDDLVYEIELNICTVLVQHSNTEKAFCGVYILPVFLCTVYYFFLVSTCSRHSESLES